MTRDKAYNIICDLNDEAYGYAWISWVKADEADDELMRERASEEQCFYFVDLFSTLDGETQKAILKYAETDEDFGVDFWCWMGGKE